MLTFVLSVAFIDNVGSFVLYTRRIDVRLMRNSGTTSRLPCQRKTLVAQ